MQSLLRVHSARQVSPSAQAEMLPGQAAAGVVSQLPALVHLLGVKKPLWHWSVPQDAPTLNPHSSRLVPSHTPLQSALPPQAGRLPIGALPMGAGRQVPASASELASPPRTHASQTPSQAVLQQTPSVQ